MRKQRLFILSFSLFFLCILNTPSYADVERYIAVPLGGGSSVFILDTREGHAWTWTHSGQGQVGIGGVNPHFTYQGNVRHNMKPKSIHNQNSQPVIQPSQPERY